MSTKKIRKVSVRLTDAEVSFIDAISLSRRVTFSEGLRWLLHQSLLLNLLEREEIKAAREKLFEQIENSIKNNFSLLLGAGTIG